MRAACVARIFHHDPRTGILCHPVRASVVTGLPLCQEHSGSCGTRAERAACDGQRRIAVISTC